MTKIKTLCVLGGTGFVGGYLLDYLTQAGYRLKVAARRPERHRHLQVLPTLDLVEADVLDPAALRALLPGCDAVINLVGILNEQRRASFQRVHVDLPRHIVAACAELGIGRYLHMSAVHADAAHGPSRYLRSKGEGEDAAHAGAAQGVQVTSFRPSVIFGPNDHFFARLATALRWSPLVLPLACPETPYAPVFVEDVARAMTAAVADSATFGQRYDLCGPRRYSLRQLVDYTALIVGRPRLIIPLSRGLSALQARLMGLLPGRPLTYDNFLTMQAGGACDQPFPAVFGLHPTAVEAVVPYFLLRRNERAYRFQAYRRASRRD